MFLKNNNGIVTEEYTSLRLPNNEELMFDLDELSFKELTALMIQTETALPGFFNFRFGCQGWDSDPCLYADRLETDKEKQIRLDKAEKARIAAEKRKATKEKRKKEKALTEEAQRKQLWEELKKEYGT